MEPIQRFDKWIKANPGELERIYLKAKTVSHIPREFVDETIEGLRDWLAYRDGQVKAKNYRLGRRFIERNLIRNWKKRRQNDTPRVGTFTGFTGKIEL